MKKAICYLILSSILVIGCTDENNYEAQDVNDGEYTIKLYNSKGDLLLTKRGSAENLVTADNHWQIRLLDPSFGLQDSDPLETFASLTIYGQSSINEPKELQFNKDNSAAFYQRWYSLENDWGYRSFNGTLNISSIDNSKIKGSFEINLEVGTNAQQNPLWGEVLLARGYFSSTCPFENVGACP